MKFSLTLLITLLLALLTSLHAGEPVPVGPIILPAMVNVLTETWRAAEITFESANTYTNPLNAAELNVVFTSPSGKKFVVPGFWDGGKTWRVRFAPTEYGVWNYVSTCTDSSDGGLHDKHGTVGANRYQGSLEIYRHGFIKTALGKRHFMYADGTPFFYLGDTHWSMPLEPFDEMFKPIVNKRVAQGFTVYQSEPLGAKYNFSNGFSEADLPGLQDLDRRFKYIADAGLVHANAELFFPPEIIKPCYTDEYLKQLCRLWVARFGAYPVMWTSGQEVDNDFYFDRGDQHYFDANSNPWKKVLAWVHEYDAYQHPGTAHMEFTGNKPEPKEFPPKAERPKYGYGVMASTSSFRQVPGHTWYGIQWSPPNVSGIHWPPVKDFWENGQGKPIVNYEGSYDHLWTLGEGARQQGWTAYLNGMFGHGYGAIDIWYYNSKYDMDNNTVKGPVTITVEQKKTGWTTSVDFPSATELGVHMKNFFAAIEWWKLTPRFDDQKWFEAEKSAWYSLATINSDVYVLYLYNWATTATGTLRNMHNTSYIAQWFNTRTGVYMDLGTFVPEKDAQSEVCRWKIPEKPTAADWVLVVKASAKGRAH
ncbi:MAG: DUF5060 domain-containing protein [Verrucomicrobiota bacterium]